MADAGRVVQTLSTLGGLCRNAYVPEGSFAEMANCSAREYPCLTARRGRSYPTLPADLGTVRAMLTRHTLQGGTLRETLLLLEETGAIRVTFQPEDATALRGGTAYFAVSVLGTGLTYQWQWSSDGTTWSNSGLASAATARLAVPATTDRDGQQYRCRLTDAAGNTADTNAATLTVTTDASAVTTVPESYGCGGADFNLRYAYRNDAGTLTWGAVRGIGLTAGEKQAVSMGSWVILFPDAVRFSVNNLRSYGYLANLGRGAIPQLDYVCECGNRLWGCRWGTDSSGGIVNELYASKLGDPASWETYDGLSTDSWRASCGADGPWTGCISYGGSPWFFRENQITKIYISAKGAHQTAELFAPGIGKGCAASAVVENGLLYYAGSGGIYCFDGSEPVKISAALGELTLQGAAAGSFRGEYLICAQSAAGTQRLTYRPANGLWSAEDSGSLQFYTPFGGSVWAVEPTEDGPRLVETGGTGGDAPEWYAVTGPLYPQRNRHRSISEVRVLGELTDRSTLTVQLAYDGGEWETLGTAPASAAGCLRFPAVPKLCESLRLRLSGTGSFLLRWVQLIGSECDG